MNQKNNDEIHRNSNLTEEISCGAFVISDNKVLLVKHKNGEHWDCPKGHIEPGETKEQTAIREVYEETGINIKIVSNKEYIVSYLINSNIKKTVIFFEAEMIDGKMKKQETEIQNMEWLSFENALQRFTFESNRKLFKKFLEDKKWI